MACPHRVSQHPSLWREVRLSTEAVAPASHPLSPRRLWWCSRVIAVSYWWQLLTYIQISIYKTHNHLDSTLFWFSQLIPLFLSNQVKAVYLGLVGIKTHYMALVITHVILVPRMRQSRINRCLPLDSHLPQGLALTLCTHFLFSNTPRTQLLLPLLSLNGLDFLYFSNFPFLSPAIE